MPLSNGTLLHNRYRILETLGQGGMGAVYRALDERLGVEVAVKENLFVNEVYARQFRREATVLASLRHPALPRVTDHFEGEGETQYLVMDYIDGEDLRQWIENNGLLSERNALVVGISICNALIYLHRHEPKIVHRDIKPGNIRITPEGRVVLVDFGLVKMLQSGQSTTAGARAMTPGYSPPEQYGTSHTDPRSDIYALGATLYAAVSGAVPEDGLARVMGEARLTPLRRHNPKISHAFATVIEKAMAVQPGDRYQSAEALRDAFYKAAESAKISLHNLILYPQVIGKGRKTTQPRPKGFMAGELFFPASGSVWRKWSIWGLVLLSLGFLLLGLWALTGFPVPRVRSSAAESPTPMIRESGTVEAETPSTQNITATPVPLAQATTTTIPMLPPQALAKASPTPIGGSDEIAFVAKTIGPLQIYRAKLDGSGLQLITRQAGGACQPAWTADGERLLFTSPCATRREWYERSNLFIINADCRDVQPITSEMAGDFDAALDSRQRLIAFTSMRISGVPRLHLLTIKDWNSLSTPQAAPMITVLAPQESNSSQPAWSPDGRFIVYVKQSSSGSQLWIMNADGTQAKPLSEGEGYYSHPRWSPDGKILVFNYQRTQKSMNQVMLSEVNQFQPRIFIDALSPRMDAEFSPDGKWLVYEGWPEGGRHSIWYADINGRNETRVPLKLENSSAEFSPVWRPAYGKQAEPIFH